MDGGRFGLRRVCSTSQCGHGALLSLAWRCVRYGKILTDHTRTADAAPLHHRIADTLVSARVGARPVADCSTIFLTLGTNRHLSVIDLCLGSAHCSSMIAPGELRSGEPVLRAAAPALREPQAAHRDLKMEADIELPRDEAGRLQRCINELAGILALPAAGVGDDPSHIAHTLLDTLLTALERRFRLPARDRAGARDGRPKWPRLAPSFGPCEAGEIGAALDRALGNDAAAWPASAQIRVGDAGLSVALAPLGAAWRYRGAGGRLAAGRLPGSDRQRACCALPPIRRPSRSCGRRLNLRRALQSASRRHPPYRKPIRT